MVQIKAGDRTVGLIRKVAEVSERQFKLSTLSPDNTEVFKNSDIVAIHKIVGSRSNIE